jgi:Reverse transcriptase (RNA-dependent DNA polymerase)/Endonuclease-reverse transcriptase
MGGLIPSPLQINNIKSSRHVIKCFYCNAQSLKNKLSDLNYILLENYNILCFSESWLSPRVTDGLLDPNGTFKIFRRDRSDGYGGVCIFISNSIQSTSIDISHAVYADAELVACRIVMGSFSLNVCCLYCPPNLSPELFKLTLDALASVCVMSETCLVFGDFNLPSLEWNKHMDPSQPKPKEFLKFCSDQGYMQLINSPTRGSNFLDLVLTNDPLIISSVVVSAPFSTSDHDSITLSVIVQDDLDKQPCAESDCVINSSRFYDYSKADWLGFALYLNNINWNSLCTNCRCANEYWAAFTNCVDNGLLTFVPKKITLKRYVSPKIKKKANHIIPNSVLNLQVKKNKLWRISKVKPTNANKSNYKKCANRIKQTTKVLAINYEKRIIESKNLGTLYKHINSRLTHKTGIAPLCDSNGNIVTDDALKADLLNYHFVKVGTIDDGTLPQFDNVCPSDDVYLDTIYFESIDICEVVSRMNANSSSGPDGYPPILLKSLIRELCVPLAMIFSLIFQCGHLPDVWKTAIVKPIFKKGNSCDPNNYRPISLTSIFCKVFESIVKKYLLSYLNTFSLLSKHQHGFLTMHSTTTNLLECLNDWTSSLDKKHFVKVLYFDYAKAFDVVSIPKLMFKLSKFGIRGRLFSCIKSFLTDRSQRVSVGYATSNSLNVISGTPQGSVLGPFLFLLFINDLPDVFETDFRAKLFADDLKSYNTFDYRSKPKSVQSSLDSLVAWSKSWQLQLAISKCGSILLKGNSYFEDVNELFIDNNPLAVLESIKDLGVLVDCKLNFSAEIDSIVTRAKQRMFLLFKSFQSRDVTLFVFAYKTYILPILEYCSTIWYPTKLVDIDRIEKVQRFFTKRLYGMQNKSYKERLVACTLPSLELRRLRTDVILCYKIIHNLIALDFNDFFVFDTNTRTRCHNFKLKLPNFKTTLRQNFYSVRVVPVWNSLPTSLVDCSTITSFKNKLNDHDLSSFLKRNLDTFK